MSKFRPWKLKKEKRKEKLHNAIRNKSAEQVKALFLTRDLKLDSQVLYLCLDYKQIDVLKFFISTKRIDVSWVLKMASTLLKIADGELFEMICEFEAKERPFDLGEYSKKSFEYAWKWRNFTLVKFLVDRGYFSQIRSTENAFFGVPSDKDKEKEETFEYVCQKILEHHGIEFCLTSEWEELRKYAIERMDNADA